MFKLSLKLAIYECKKFLSVNYNISRTHTSTITLDSSDLPDN